MASVMMACPARDSFHGYPQQYAMYPGRTTHQTPADPSQAMNVNPYSNYAPLPESQTVVQTQSKSPQSSASPVGEDGIRPSLPPISNLLGIADGERPTQDTASQKAQAQAQQQSQFHQQPVQTIANDQRQQAAYQSNDLSSSQRGLIPPTPPLRNDSVLDSPSTISTGSSLSVGQPYFVGSALNNVEASEQRAGAPHFIKRHSVPSQPNLSPYGAPYSNSPYVQSPGTTVSSSSYYSPTDPNIPGPGIYHQRPLPSNFPPQSPMTLHHQQKHHQNGPPTLPKVWEHHHYINPSSQATFPQSQDRYICPTCAKAFSRPSSLKIHSHSHTGEKPFKCPHASCGKSFSVRSNMKRHERGCHAAGTPLFGTTAHLG